MPVYRDSIEISNGGQVMQALRFDYNPTNDENTKQQRKQLLSVESCLTLGTKNFANLTSEQKENFLQEGLVYSGYYIKTINGPYDYGYKLWIDRRLAFAPANAKVPPEDEPQEAIIIDENRGYYGIACGPHLAFSKVNAFKKAGITKKKVKLPFSGFKVMLRLAKDGRPEEIPYAAFEAIPAGEDEATEDKAAEDKVTDEEVKALTEAVDDLTL